MKQWSILLLLMLFVGSAQLARRVSSNLFRFKREGISFGGHFGDAGTSCTFDGQTGSCIELKDCRPATSLLSNPSSANLLTLQKMTCEFQGTIPFVCCTNVDSDQPPILPLVLNPPPVVAAPSLPPGPKRNFRDVCGFSDGMALRILGGISAEKDAWPWMAAIFIKVGSGKRNSFVTCGGALISDEYVATAANCLFMSDGITRRLPSTITVRLGDVDILSTNKNAQSTEVGVSEIIPHPGYNAKTFRNDIALLRLDRLITFTKSVQPICLPIPSLKNEDLTGLKPHITGWGTVSFGGNSSEVLRQVQVEIVSNDQCKKAYSNFVEVTIVPAHLCAGDQHGGKDACTGDSGGPMMLVRNERWTLVGIISTGFKCGLPGFPGVYTRVTEYLDWLLTNSQME